MRKKEEGGGKKEEDRKEEDRKEEEERDFKATFAYSLSGNQDIWICHTGFISVIICITGFKETCSFILIELR